MAKYFVTPWKEKIILVKNNNQQTTSKQSGTLSLHVNLVKPIKTCK